MTFTYILCVSAAIFFLLFASSLSLFVQCVIDILTDTVTNRHKKNSNQAPRESKRHSTRNAITLWPSVHLNGMIYTRSHTHTHMHTNRMLLNLSYLLMNMKQLRINKRTNEQTKRQNDIQPSLFHTLPGSFCFRHSFINSMGFFSYMSMHTHTKTALTDKNEMSANYDQWPQYGHDNNVHRFFCFFLITLSLTHCMCVYLYIKWTACQWLSSNLTTSILTDMNRKWINQFKLGNSWCMHFFSLSLQIDSSPLHQLLLLNVFLLNKLWCM